MKFNLIINQHITDKIRGKGFKLTELNLFNILTCRGLESNLKFTNEPMSSKSCPYIYANEFHQFLGSLLHASAFNLPMEHSFYLMEMLTGSHNVKMGDYFMRMKWVQ
jgi:hypothetical protein